MFIEQRSEFIIALRAVSSIKSFLRIILCLRLDSFSKSLIDHLVDQENSTIFDIDQRIIYLQSLIDLSRTRRSILNQRLLGKKLFELITSDKSVCRYFKKLIELTGCSEKHGLDQESIRYVIRCMRRSSDQSVWNLDLIEELWNQCFLDEISKDNHRTEVYSRLSEGLIIHLIKNHSVNSNGSPNIKSVVSTCLRIWSKLLELGQISLEDFSTEFKTFHSTSTQSPQDLEPTDRVIYKVLTSIVRSSHSQLKSFSTRKQSNYHILKDSSEALEALIDRFGYSSSASEQIENLVRDHLKIYFSRVLEEVEDRRFPTREMMEVIFKFTNLSSVTGRWSTSGISRDDYSIFQEALESLFRLGKSRMLLECWLKLLPIININRTGWSLSKLLKSLEELSNPLIVGGSDAKKVMNPFKFARLVLKLFESLDSSYSQDGTSYGTKKDRFDGFRMIFERKELYEFDWIRREEKRFDREGFLIEDDEKDQVEDFKERRVEKLVERNLDIIINLWNFSWGITGVGPFKTLERDREGEDDVLLPVSVLIGVTRLTDSIKNQKAQKFLKLVINKFIFDRTFYPKAKLLTKKPSKDQPQQLHQILQHTTNKHKEEIRVYDGLFKPSLRLSDLERSSLISSHLTILRLDQQRGDFSLSEKFVKELFESYLEEKVVISAEDLVLMREFIDCTSN
ncbi:hypothetical protein BY996DRAFT_4575583 [Phakopsora pachyrhizi]|nr:hypothetical protein BY996DRAFT_4575583 [Phakopsora pachyrhizi]